MITTPLRFPLASLLVALAMIVLGPAAQAAGKPIRVLIIDGINNHDWKRTTEATKATLLATGKFLVDVSTSPGKKADRDAWKSWNPQFSNYDVVLSNYNDGGKSLWSDATKKALVEFVKGGGGFVAVHAADNSSSDWPEYNAMIAVGGWGGRKPETHGSLLRKIDGKWAADAAPDGRSGSHGAQWEFPVRTETPGHPIMKDLPPVWKHSADELYNSLRGPAENVTILASAPSKQTKTDEPMAMIITYGKGTVFHIAMGHVGNNGPLRSVHCVGFQTLLARGTEFAATGAVTIPVPEGFPSADKSSIIDPSKVGWDK